MPFDKENARNEAIKWWQHSHKKKGTCDYCCKKKLKPNKGYILKDIVVNIGGLKQVYSELLVCKECFSTLRDNPSLPKHMLHRRSSARYELRVCRPGAEDALLNGRIGVLSGTDLEFIKDSARSRIYMFEDPIVLDNETGLRWSPKTDSWE